MALVGDENVLRLQVAMVDPQGMAILNGIQNLQEGMLGQLVVAHEQARLGDVGEQVTLWAKFHHDEGAVRAVQDAEQRDHIGMLASLVMESDLPALEASLSLVQSQFGQGLHGIRDVGQDVDGLVDDSIGANSKDGHELQTAG